MKIRKKALTFLFAIAAILIIVSVINYHDENILVSDKPNTWITKPTKKPRLIEETNKDKNSSSNQTKIESEKTIQEKNPNILQSDKMMLSELFEKGKLSLSDLNSDQIEEFLKENTIGRGKEFDYSIENDFVSINKILEVDQIDSIANQLNGTWLSNYTNNNIPIQFEPDSQLELTFDELKLTTKLRNENGKVIYTAIINNFAKVLGYDTKNSFPSFMITLPAVPSRGYNHNRYIHLFPSKRYSIIIATLYNTNQHEPEKIYYDQAEYMIFEKI